MSLTTGSGKLRELAPAAPISHSAPLPERSRPPGDPNASKNVLPRRNLVKNACRNCQVKKTKCDGRRPQCSRCLAKALVCQYDTMHEGMTKQESTEYELKRLNDTITDMETKFRVLKFGTPDEMQAMLATIRQDAGPDLRGQVESSTTSGSIHSSISSPVDVDTPNSSALRFPPLLFDRREWEYTLLKDGDGESAHQGRSQGDTVVDGPSGGFVNSQVGPGQQQQQRPSQSQMNYHGLIPPDPSNFGNLPFSDSIHANHYPEPIQQQQVGNIFEPLWAILPLTTMPGAPSVKESVTATIRQAILLIQSGQTVESVVGRQCNIAAAFNQDQYQNSTLLSQWAAGFIFSIQHKTRSFVAFASMHLAWTLARWMIDPRPDTYEAIPEFYRPTMNQLFMPHVEIIDFVIWPALRELVVNHPDTQKDFRWLHEYGHTLDCDWFLNLELSLGNALATGENYLSRDAQECAELLGNWSIGSSVRQYMTNIDSIARVRVDHDPGLLPE